MNKGMDKLDIYNNSATILYNKTPKKIISWITILIILLILIIIIFHIPFNVFKNYSGIIILENNKSYINLLVDRSDFPINKENEMYIKTAKYNYKVLDIKEDNILLEVNLKDNIKINNNIVNISIKKEKITILKIIKNKIKKGFDL